MLSKLSDIFDRHFMGDNFANLVLSNWRNIDFIKVFFVHYEHNKKKL